MRPILFVILFLIITPACLSQDYIYKMDGTIEEGKVIEVTIDIIKYHKLELPKGPVFEMLKEDIHKILFENGYEEVFNKKLTSNQTDNALGQDSMKPSLSLGDHYQGSIIFYLDATGQHGLIATTEIRAVKWSTVYETTDAVYMNDGQLNTRIIVEYMTRRIHVGKNVENTAPFICNNLSIKGYSDWYLPSIQELKLLLETEDKLGKVIAGTYWSSTEYSWTKAYSLTFMDGYCIEDLRKKYTDRLAVRCIRKF